MFEHIPTYPGDPILSLVEAFEKDPRADKVNLSIGYYYDELGLVPELETVEKALIALENDPKMPSTYLPMSGYLDYREGVQTLLFGTNSKAKKEKQIATIQTIGGSGALHLGAAFLHRYYPNSEVFVSQPTWGNHISIFEAVGFKVNPYPYYDAHNHCVNFDAMMGKLAQLPPESIVLLHPCCHNPTGADLTLSQWNRVLKLMKEKKLIPFMDIAYQGFGHGIDEDAYAIRYLEQISLFGLVANSFSKSFSLYGERVGALSVLCQNLEIAQNVLGQLESLVRVNYSNPPAFGAKIVKRILNFSDLFQSWQNELDKMRERILSMRKALVEHLRAIDPSLNVGHFLIDQGLFSMTGLTSSQIDELKQHSGIYLVNNGRMCIAGLTEQNVEKVAKALAPYLS